MLNDNSDKICCVMRATGQKVERKENYENQPQNSTCVRILYEAACGGIIP